MKSELKVSLATLLAVVLCAGLATAQEGDAPRPERDRPQQAEGDGAKHDEGAKDGHGDKGERPKRRPDPLMKDITLDDDQKAKLKELREANKEEAKALRAEMKEAKDSRDEEAIKAAAAKLLAFNEKMQGEIRDLLTAEQQEQFDKNIKAMKERGQRHRAEGAEGERPRRGEGGEGGGEKGGESGGDMQL